MSTNIQLISCHVIHVVRTKLQYNNGQVSLVLHYSVSYDLDSMCGLDTKYPKFGLVKYRISGLR